MSGCGRVLANSAVTLGRPYRLRCSRAHFLNSDPGTLGEGSYGDAGSSGSFFHPCLWRCRWISRVFQVSFHAPFVSWLRTATVTSPCHCQIRLDRLEGRRSRPAASSSRDRQRAVDVECQLESLWSSSARGLAYDHSSTLGFAETEGDCFSSLRLLLARTLAERSEARWLTNDFK